MCGFQNTNTGLSPSRVLLKLCINITYIDECQKYVFHRLLWHHRNPKNAWYLSFLCSLIAWKSFESLHMKIFHTCVWRLGVHIQVYLVYFNDFLRRSLIGNISLSRAFGCQTASQQPSTGRKKQLSRSHLVFARAYCIHYYDKVGKIFNWNLLQHLLKYKYFAYYKQKQ
jgi:hypothetical protein